MALVITSLLVMGCGKKEDEEPTAATGGEEMRNELVALRTRVVGRGGPRVSLATEGVTNLPGGVPAEEGPVANELAQLEPGADWKSEELSAAALQQLKMLWKEGLAGVVTANVMSTDLRPDDLAATLLHGGLVVHRPSRELSAVRRPGGAQLAQSLSDLRAAFGGAAVEAFFKVVRVSVESGHFETEFLAELRSAGGADNPRQIVLRCGAGWEDGDPPRLVDLVLRDYEEAHWEGSGGGRSFADVTSSVLGATGDFEELVLTGVDAWATRLTRLGDFALTGHHGLAVGDVNGDGREDLFACDGGSLPNRLYLQEADGTLRDHSEAAGLDWYEDSRSALLVDLDNDGDQDLVVGTIAMIAFAENDGSGRFTLRGGHPGARYPFSLSAADYDLDGDLDLYACVYGADDDPSARGFEAASPTPFHDARNGGRNVLLANLGGFRFADATRAAGLDVDNTRWSFAAAWEDFDRDGDPDLYVANDFGRNCLYRNEAGVFRQVADEMGVEDMASGMSVAWGDFNRDGRADLYVGNMFSSAGGRVAYQRAFAEGGDRPVVEGLQRMARGNSLFSGEEEGGFRDVSETTGAHLGRWAWSSGFADINNDGWEDLVVANGYLTGGRLDDL